MLQLLSTSTIYHRLGEEADVLENHSSPFATVTLRTRELLLLLTSVSTATAAAAAAAAYNIHRVRT